jgi:hypothetical protein
MIDLATRTLALVRTEMSLQVSYATGLRRHYF